MNTLFRSTLFIFLLVQTLPVEAQRRPDWVRETPFSENTCFQYYVGFGGSENEDVAYNKAQADAVEQLIRYLGVYVDATTSSQMEMIARDEKISYVEKIEKIIKMSDSRQVRNFHQIERHSEKKGKNYKYYVLYILEKCDYRPKETDYKILKPGALALIPSAGQFYKREKTKGTLLLTGGLLAIGGFFTSSSLASQNYQKAKQHNTNQFLIDKYEQRGDNWRKAKIGSVIAGGVIYLYSVIDALATPGPRIYSFLENLEIKQYAANDMTGVTISYPLKFKK